MSADELTAALSDFRLAAARRGEYLVHQEASSRLLIAIRGLLVPSEAMWPHEEAAAALEELDRELRRLIVNISCRIGQRKPALRAMRAALVAVHRQAREHARACGVLLPDPRKPAPPPNASEAVELTRETDTDSEGTAIQSSVGCWQLAVHGPRHLCENQCYFKEYEAVRQARARSTGSGGSRFFASSCPAAVSAAAAAGPSAERPPVGSLHVSSFAGSAPASDTPSATVPTAASCLLTGCAL